MKTTPSAVVAHNTSSTTPLPRSNHNSNPHFALQHEEQWNEKYQQQQDIQQPQPVMIKSHG